MKRRFSFVTAILVLLTSVFFLWMFFVAATLERTAEKCGRRIAALSLLEPDADFPAETPALKIAVLGVE